MPHTSRAVVLLFGGSVLLGTLLAAVPREIPGIAVGTVLGGAWLSLVLAITLPSRAERAGAELARRLARFRDAVHAVGDEPARADLERLLQQARALELRDEEIAEELTHIRAALDAVAVNDQLQRGELPVVAAAGLAPGDPCHFAAPVRFGRRRVDQFGHLLLTGGWLKFRGPFDMSVAWPEVSAVERAGAEIIFSLGNSRRTLRFACQTPAEAARGGVIAQYLARTAREEAHLDAAGYHAAM